MFLIRLDAVSLAFGSRKLLREAGLSIEPAERVCLVGRNGAGTWPDSLSSIIARCKGAGNGRSLILFAHPDGEPVTGTDRWRHDPFAGEVEDGRLYGWGVADDLSGVAAGLQDADAGL